MMAPTTVVLDTEAVSDTIVTTLKKGFGDRLIATIKAAFDKGFEQLAKAISSSCIQSSQPQADLNGLRNQIIANVQILLPIISSTHGMSLVMGQQFAIMPDIHVITVGHEPAIKSYILQGNATCCEKFLESRYGVTAADALKKMLLRTQELLDVHVEEIGTYSVKHSSQVSSTLNRKLHHFTKPHVKFDFTPSTSRSSSYSSDEDAFESCHRRSLFTYR